MAKPHQTKNVELRKDAWSRFERAVDIVAKSPPQHRAKVKSAKANSPRKSAKKKRAPHE
jgi:hypothetical protein